MNDTNEMVIKRHERDILALILENRGLDKKIKRNEVEIKKLEKFNQEILGR